METSYVLKIPDKKFQDFHLLFCGYAVCEPLHHFGPAVRPNYIIHVVLSGKGYYYVGEEKYTLGKGQGFLILPDVLTRYEADEEDPWTYIWIGFDGTNSMEHLRNIGIGADKLFFQSQSTRELEEVVMDMLQYKKLDVRDEYRIQSLLYLFFSLIANSSSDFYKEETSKENDYITKSIEFIQTHYNEKIKVTDIAHYVSLNRSYLTTLFRKRTGVSIQQYLAQFRLTRAVELLALTDLSIEQIAESCGYSDPLVFSKAFKREKGISPTKYRERERLEGMNTREKREGLR
ncbi:AraC family transcriptional regulator [Priestia filamentosa]|uniref:AraC family transcriptional regulator n=1 Tax=Priestia filamentosa TaxID=1402861 RepID=UPI0039820DE5